jgi:hypothetical protein
MMMMMIIIITHHYHHHCLRLFKSSLKEIRTGNLNPRLQVPVTHFLTRWHVWIPTDIVFRCHIRFNAMLCKTAYKANRYNQQYRNTIPAHTLFIPIAKFCLLCVLFLFPLSKFFVNWFPYPSREIFQSVYHKELPHTRYTVLYRLYIYIYIYMYICVCVFHAFYKPRRPLGRVEV